MFQLVRIAEGLPGAGEALLAALLEGELVG